MFPKIIMDELKAVPFRTILQKLIWQNEGDILAKMQYF